MDQLFTLQEGSTFSVVAPSGVVNREEVLEGVRLLEKMGFQVRYHPDIFSQDRYLAGSDATRARLLHEALCEPTVDAILFARGGSGSVRVLNQLGENRVREWRSKPIFGFSDTTVLLNFVAEQLGWVSFHSPVLTSLVASSSEEQEHWRKTLQGGMKNGYSLIEETDEEKLEILNEGEAEGDIAGGNLSTLVSLIGTPWQVTLDNKILFLEDVNEPPYSLDRMLCQLRFSGLLRKLKGVILGEFTMGKKRIPETELNIIFKDLFCDLGIPVISGFPAGHGTINRILPIGSNIIIRTAPKVSLTLSLS